MNDQRRTTRDIDAALHPADVIKAVARIEHWLARREAT
jgi:hypothetical protein